MKGVESKMNKKETNKISKILSDTKVTLLSKNIVTEKDTVKIEVKYKLKKRIKTKTYVNLMDIDRGLSLCAGSVIVSTPKDGCVKRVFCASLASINDTKIQVAVSICDEDAGSCVVFPDNEFPSFMFRWGAYPNPNERKTYAVLFDRGAWFED